MDAAQRETPPRLPAQDLLPLLAQDDHHHTVLLADPGMGKSTLIQSLIAHLASGRPLNGAPALNGLLPVPLILRDLVPLLPQDQVAGWTWDRLLTVLIKQYQRDETAPTLCDCFKDHRDEFRQILHTDTKVFFLIDGLDEIGDLAKRRQIIRCIHDGIRLVNKEARWLITSRVIGYDQAPVDLVQGVRKSEPDEELYYAPNAKVFEETIALPADSKNLKSLWIPFAAYPTNLTGSHRWLNDSEGIAKDDIITSIECEEEANGKQRVTSLGYCIWIARRLHLVPFDDKRQDLFTQRWFQHRHSMDYSRELMREVRAHHHDGVRIISRVPNLLCMMNILKRSGKPLPDGRAALYDAIVLAYLGGIDAAYRPRPVHGNTCPFDAQRRFLLALLGAHMQQTRTAIGVTDQTKDNEKKAGKAPEARVTSLISRPELEKLLSPPSSECGTNTESSTSTPRPSCSMSCSTTSPRVPACSSRAAAMQ